MSLSIIVVSALFAFFVAGSGFLLMSESAMRSVSRRRMRQLADQKNPGALRTLVLLEQNENLLRSISFFYRITNTASVAICCYAAFTLPEPEPENRIGFIFILIFALALLAIASAIPKVLGAAHANTLAPKISLILMPLTHLLGPALSLTLKSIRLLLRNMRLIPKQPELRPPFPLDDLCSFILESSEHLSQKNRSILLNLCDLEQISVEDIMIPRAAMETIDIGLPHGEIMHQIRTAYHSRLPAYRHEPGQILGIIHLRRLFSRIEQGGFDTQIIEESLLEPYFIPAATPALAQLQYFQESKDRLALVVDEYGEIMGLVTLADIIKEIVGEFTTPIPEDRLKWVNDSVLIEGSRSLREINRKLGIKLPTDGPKTLNGLILEHFRDIPESGIGIKIAGIPIEIVQTQGKSVKTARVFKPIP